MTDESMEFALFPVIEKKVFYLMSNCFQFTIIENRFKFSHLDMQYLINFFKVINQLNDLVLCYEYVVDYYLLSQSDRILFGFRALFTKSNVLLWKTF